MLAAFILNLIFSFLSLYLFKLHLMLLLLPSYRLSSNLWYITSAGRNAAETSAEAATNDIEKQSAYVCS